MGKRRRVEVDATLASTSAPFPYVCYFPTGAPPSAAATDAKKAKHQAAAGDGLQFAMYTKSVGRSGQQVLVGSQKRLDYVGTTAGLEYSTQQPCSYALGVYDKESGKLQLVPVQGSKVLRMEARLHGLDYGPSGLAAEDGVTREERMAQNKRLVDAFGSTRRRRQLTAREEGVVRSEKISSPAALMAMLKTQANEAEKQGLTKEKVLQRVTKERNLPPHHPEASTPAEAYRLDELIPEVAADSLDTKRLVAAANDSEYAEELKSKGALPDYVAERLHLLRDPDSAKAAQRARTLAFIWALLSLVKSRADHRINPLRGLQELGRRLDIKPLLLQEMLELFYNRRREGNMDVYERPSQKKELLLAYLLVAVQLLEGGGLAAAQFETLRNELKMTAMDLVSRFREVGSTCAATTVRSDAGEGELAAQRSYNVILLKDNKTLGESFPGIKMGPRKK